MIYLPWLHLQNGTRIRTRHLANTGDGCAHAESALQVRVAEEETGRKTIALLKSGSIWAAHIILFRVPLQLPALSRVHAAGKKMSIIYTLPVSGYDLVACATRERRREHTARQELLSRFRPDV